MYSHGYFVVNKIIKAVPNCKILFQNNTFVKLTNRGIDHTTLDCMKPFERVALLILDGWGQGKRPDASAIAQAKTPFVDQFYTQYPHSTLVTYGNAVGLPEGQMGNSEVGHLNIGAGRIVHQELVRINNAIEQGDLAKNTVLLNALQTAQRTGKRVHFMGLLSDGGVHAHLRHLMALCDIALEEGLTEIYLHAFLDGRDTGPTTGTGYLRELLDHIEGTPIQLASIIGRYYAMDRDQRWERIQRAYDLLTKAKGERVSDPIAAVQAHYNQGTTDEFMPPLVAAEAVLQPGDVVLCYNYRTDRCRQLISALTQTSSPAQTVGMLPLEGHFLTMTRYDEQFEGLGVLFEKENLTQTLGEVVANAGLTQLRLAETEKYPHVTFFFSGGREATFEGEKRLIVPSPKVATYDLQPSMSAVELTDTVLQELQVQPPHLLVLNYANTDMVGHTGVFEAAVAAAETVDGCLSRLVPALLKQQYAILVIADHGNADCMINEDGSPHTAHTTNLVPCFLLTDQPMDVTLTSGKLGDVAPTLLELLDLEKPVEMTGVSLLKPT